MSEKVEPKDPHVPLKKRILDFFKTLILSIYPDSYSRFSEKRLMQGMHYFLSVALLTLILTGILLAFTLPSAVNHVTGELQKFDNFTVNVNMELNQDITLADQTIRIAEKADYQGEKLLITKENITMQKPSCFVFSPICWFSDEKINLKTENLSNTLEFEEEINNAIKSFAIVLFPALMLGLSIFVVLKSLILMLFLFILSSIIAKSAKLRLERRQKILICIYAVTIYMIGEPFSILVGGFYMAHLIVAIVLAAIGVALVGDKKHRY